MSDHHKINYIEMPAKDLKATKQFFTTVFGWNFTNFGPDYTAFTGEGVDGGFFRSDVHMSADHGSALIVLYSKQLEKTQLEVENAGGVITTPIFSFPGGRRFHFVDPNANEFAVWSE